MQNYAYYGEYYYTFYDFVKIIASVLCSMHFILSGLGLCFKYMLNFDLLAVNGHMASNPS